MSLKKQRGLALQDMMLAVAILGFITAASLPLIGRNVDDLTSQSVAADWQSFKAIAEQHFVANRSAYEAAMTDGTGADALCKINVNTADGTGGIVANSTTLHTCAIDTSMLQYFRVLPDTIRTTNVYGEKWVAIYRLIYNTATPPVPTGGVESIIVSADVTGVGGAVAADSHRYQVAKSAADYVNGGGVVPDADRTTCTASKATSTFQACGNGWQVNLADFIDPASMVAFGNRLDH